MVCILSLKGGDQWFRERVWPWVFVLEEGEGNGGGKRRGLHFVSQRWRSVVWGVGLAVVLCFRGRRCRLVVWGAGLAVGVFVLEEGGVDRWFGEQVWSWVFVLEEGGVDRWFGDRFIHGPLFWRKEKGSAFMYRVLQI